MNKHPNKWALAQEVTELLRTSVRQGIAAAKGQVIAKATEVAGDVVTDTDFAIQAMLHENLIPMVKGSDFIGEEGFEAVDSLQEQPYWIVDPLDGTLNFSCELPFYGASVALIERGQPVLGVVYDYGSDITYAAVAGHGARQNGQDMRWNETLAARSPVGISSGFLARMRTENPAGINYNPEWLGSRFRIFGSQAVQLCWAAAGRLRLNINVEAKLWDDAAGALICREAGAGYEALASSPLYPLTANSPALAGQSLFSVSGSPELVELCRQDF